MNAMTATILTIGGLAVLGAIIGAVVATVFQAGNAGRGGLAVVFALIGAAGGWWLNEHSIQPGLAYQASAKSADASPDVLALKRYYPEDYKNMQTALVAAKDDRKGAAGAQYLVRLQIRDTVRRQVKLGGDKQLVALMTLQRDEAKALAAKSPKYCMEYFNGGRWSFDPTKELSSDILQRDAAVSADLLTQTATAPDKDAAGAEQRDLSYASRYKLYLQNNVREAVLEKAMAGFSKDEQKTINLMARRKANLRGQTALSTLMCNYKIALLEETLKLPEEKAAMTFRMNQSVYF